MVYVIFKVSKADTSKIDRLLKDDTVSRQSIIIREANALEMKGDETYVKIEGSSEGVKRAEELAKDAGFVRINEKEASDINKRIEEQEDSAATGMGMIFD
ncbi:MAG: hypothetical protein QXS02_02275 [Candidatus Thermoplasmatota archaeon]